MQDDLFQVSTRSVGDDLVPTTDARSIHMYLENGDHFAGWIKNRIETFGFVEGTDFVTYFAPNPNGKGGRPSKEYAVTLGMAKELCMVERNELGRTARKYFIDCERYARELVFNAPTAPQAPAVEDIRNAEAILLQRDIAVAYHMEQMQRLTGKMYRAVKPPKPREPKALPPPDDKTQHALDSLLSETVEFMQSPTPIRNLLAIAVAPIGDEVNLQPAALSALRPIGILIEGKFAVFGPSVAFLQGLATKLFGDSKGLRPFLANVPGAEKPDKTYSFSGTKSKGILIPVETIVPRMVKPA